MLSISADSGGWYLCPLFFPTGMCEAVSKHLLCSGPKLLHLRLKNEWNADASRETLLYASFEMTGGMTGSAVFASVRPLQVRKHADLATSRFWLLLRLDTEWVIGQHRKNA